MKFSDFRAVTFAQETNIISSRRKGQKNYWGRCRKGGKAKYPAKKTSELEIFSLITRETTRFRKNS